MRTKIFSIIIAGFFLGNLLLAQSYTQHKTLGSEYFKHADTVMAVAATPDGQHLVSADGKDLLVWDRTTGKKLKTISKMEFGIYSMAIAPNGKIIALEDRC